MAYVKDVVFDCRHAGTLARFWADALDGYSVAPYDEAEVARLRSQGIDDLIDDPTVCLISPDSPIRVWFQTVADPKTVKNRLHLDLACKDRSDLEIERLVQLGATRHPNQSNEMLVVLLDPEGNEFCVLLREP